jgi:hypothetical protein
VHYTSSDMSRMVPWTNGEVRDALTHLSQQWDLFQEGRLSRIALNRIETRLGWNHCPDGLLTSDMAARANLPDAVCYDWMHSICSSGGVAQYETQQLLRRIMDESEDPDATMQQMDAIAAKLVHPKRLPHKNITLSERMSKKKYGHVRMFAAEVIQVVVFLGLYCQLVLEPKKILQEETQCFILLGRILYLLRAGASAVKKQTCCKT